MDFNVLKDRVILELNWKEPHLPWAQLEPEQKDVLQVYICHLSNRPNQFYYRLHSLSQGIEKCEFKSWAEAYNSGVSVHKIAKDFAEQIFDKIKTKFSHLPEFWNDGDARSGFEKNLTDFVYDYIEDV